MPVGAQPTTDFERFVESRTADLQAHCYRMLGSLDEADDALQEALMRAWKALPRFRGQSSYRTWLYRIATNVCLDALADRPKRALPVDFGDPLAAGEPEASIPLPAARWVDPYPDEGFEVGDADAGPQARFERRESLELAFVAALQHLSPRQRAVLVARDVLGFSAKEAAEILGTSSVAVNGALLRARARIEARLPDQSQQASLRTIGDERVRRLAERFAESFERGEVEAILELLSDEATFQMPPFPGWRRGKEAISDSWLMPVEAGPRLRYAQTRASGQLAFGAYLRSLDAPRFEPIALDVLTLEPGGTIASIAAFRAIDGLCFERFGLPAAIGAEAER